MSSRVNHAYERIISPLRLLSDRFTIERIGARCRRVSRGLMGLLVTLPFAVQHVGAQETAPREKIGVVLSNLPAQGSREYQYLLDVSGATGGEQLPMSGSEMWLVDPGQADMFTHVYEEQGVTIDPVDDRFSELMSVMPESDIDQAMVERIRQSDLVTSVSVARLNKPGIVEFALGRGKKPMIGSERPPQSASNEITIPLNETETITASRIRVITTQEGCYWHGRIGDTEFPISLMWWPNGRMAGAFTYNNKHYVIRNLTGDQHAIMEIDPDRMPAEHPIMPPAFRDRYRAPDGTPRLDRAPVERLENLQDAKEGQVELPDEFEGLLDLETPSLEPKIVKDRMVEISVLFAYTKKAASHYTDIRNDVIALAVEQSTQSFRNSKVDNVTVTVAGSYLVDYDEGDDNLFNHLWNFADRGDGHLDEIHKLRDEKKADVAILLVDNPTGCGLATRIAAGPEEAFAVVNHECATTTFSVAHELGHLLGARHDRSLDQSTQPFPYGHGFANQTKWRTMMAYRSSCNGCPRLPLWSSPNVEVQGEYAGDPMTHNARVIAEQAARVAAFR